MFCVFRASNLSKSSILRPKITLSFLMLAFSDRKCQLNRSLASVGHRHFFSAGVTDNAIFKKVPFLKGHLYLSNPRVKTVAVNGIKYLFVSEDKSSCRSS